MAYGLLCNIPFTSLNGTSCLIQVWKDNYTGSTRAIYNITPDNPNTPGYAADDPFYYEEDNEQDLLKFVRVKTGYIRLVERDNDSLAFLRPSYPLEHYVRVYYGSYNEQSPRQNLVFTGYMQYEEFSNDWVAPPSVKEFPVVSPLGMLSNFSFGKYTPQKLTLGEIMSAVLTKLSAPCQDSHGVVTIDYNYVVWPGGQKVVADIYEGATYPWDGLIHSTAICPFNPDFKHYSPATDLYAPCTLDFFIEGLCVSNGWMLHDECDTLVFTKFNNNDKWYDRLTLAQLTSIPSSSEEIYLDKPYWSSRQNIEDYFEIDGDDGCTSVHRPLKNITLKVPGANRFSKPEPLDYTNDFQCSALEYETDKYVNALAGTPVGPMIYSDFGAYPGGFSAIEVIDYNHARVGFPGLTYLMRFNKTQDIYNKYILRLKYHGPIPTRGCLLAKLHMKMGTNPAEMEEQQDWKEWVAFGGSSEQEFTQIIPNAQEQIAMSDMGDTDGVLFHFNSEECRVVDSFDLILTFSPTSPLSSPIQYPLLPDVMYMQFDITLSDPVKSDFFSEGFGDEVVISGSVLGGDEKSLTCNISNFGLYPSNNSYGDEDGYITGPLPDFRCEIGGHNFLEVPLSRKNVALPTSIYLPRWNFWRGSNYDWRVIGVNFHPRSDEYRLLMAHSDLINYTPPV